MADITGLKPEARKMYMVFCLKSEQKHYLDLNGPHSVLKQ